MGNCWAAQTTHATSAINEDLNFVPVSTNNVMMLIVMVMSIDGDFQDKTTKLVVSALVYHLKDIYIICSVVFCYSASPLNRRAVN